MLLYSIIHEKPNSLKKLIEYGADINKPSPNNISPIQAILQQSQFELFRMMLENKISLSDKIINDPTISEKPISALHYIAKRTRNDFQDKRDSEIYSMLTEFGINAEGEDR
jgi:ankyrin repeat protein